MQKCKINKLSCCGYNKETKECNSIENCQHKVVYINKELNFTKEEINELKRMANALINDRVVCRCYEKENTAHKWLNDKYLEMDYEILKKIIMLEERINEEQEIH